MCDFGKVISRLFTPQGTGGKEAAAEQELAQARAGANAALLAQQQALDQSKASSDSASEVARQASESRLKKMLAGGPFGASFSSSNLGAAPVGTRQLFGA